MSLHTGTKHGRLGSRAHAAEELRADIASALMYAVLRLLCDIPSHPGYLQDWLDELRQGSSNRSAKGMERYACRAPTDRRLRRAISPGGQAAGSIRRSSDAQRR